jgi:acetylxylan esterase
MTNRFSVARVLLLASIGALMAMPARAASPTRVTADWSGGVSGLPSDVSMYVYVPTKVATNPPILTLIHYCGGSAQAVFSQAQGGGLITAADQYGFILVVPSNGDASGANGRCWDVTSSKAQTRDGKGDPHAIIQMVKYAISQYHANADRIYSTGDSSGAMMTELLLALYPDIYKAGSAFAGVPAGCSNAFDGSGQCGRGAQTAQQWGDRVRAMDPGYSGHRPRVQLFHGDADTTIVYKNLGEAIKEWTNVLGLPTDPTSTETGVKLGNHQAKREKWQNTCGYVVLDAFTSQGGDHGPSDALFLSQYVVPFLGLDKTGPVDPEIEQCGGGNAGDAGAGGSTGSGGTSGNGGAGDAGPGGRDAGPIGAGGVGGGSAAGGNGATGGRGSGGAGGGGGETAAGQGGSDGSGGEVTTGGDQGSGGSMAGSGGVANTGGKTASGGKSGTGSGGIASSGGSESSSTGGATTANDSSSSGCGCTLGGKPQPTGLTFAAVLFMLMVVASTRRRS